MAIYVNGVARQPLTTESVAGDVTLAPMTQVARVDTSAARAVTIPTAALWNGNQIIILDVVGSAGLNNITVATEGAEDIDGQDTVIIASGYGSLIITSDGTNWFSGGRSAA